MDLALGPIWLCIHPSSNIWLLLKYWHSFTIGASLLNDCISGCLSAHIIHPSSFSFATEIYKIYETCHVVLIYLLLPSMLHPNPWSTVSIITHQHHYMRKLNPAWNSLRNSYCSLPQICHGRNGKHSYAYSNTVPVATGMAHMPTAAHSQQLVLNSL